MLENLLGRGSGLEDCPDRREHSRRDSGRSWRSPRLKRGPVASHVSGHSKFGLRPISRARNAALPSRCSGSGGGEAHVVRPRHIICRFPQS